MKDALAVPESAAMVLSVARSPEDVLEEAHRAAKALKGVIDAKPEDKKVKFNDEVYLEFEDWSTVGQFYGIKPVTDWTKFIDLGEGIRGWEARAEAIHVPTGRVVASAEAMCLNDEEKWRARPKYEWHYVKKTGGTSKDDPGRDEIIWEKKRTGAGNAPKKARVLIGEEAVPNFQLRSMAQTRAGAKAMRNALSWVVVLAGYRPTPAEEMPDHRGPETIDTTARRVDATETEPPFAYEAERLFPDPPPAARNRARGVENAGSVDDVRDPETHRPFLAGRIVAALKARKATKAEAKRLFAEFLGTDDPGEDFAKVDVAALQALYVHLGEAA